jgi:transposase-like protein
MSDFPADFAVIYDEQVYRPVCVIPHTNQKGEQTRIVEWLTNCPTCGVEFTVKTGMMVGKWRRRCDACKSPRHVKTDRKHFLAKIRGDEP